MDIGNGILIVVSIAVFILPFVFIGRKGRKRKKKLKNQMLAYAQANQFTLGEHELLPNIIVGIDTESKIAFIGRIIGDSEAIKHLVLSDYKSCKLIRQTREVKYEHGSEIVLNQLRIQFTTKKKNGEDSFFVLYDENESGRIGNELSVANKWITTYSKLMK